MRPDLQEKTARASAGEAAAALERRRCASDCAPRSAMRCSTAPSTSCRVCMCVCVSEREKGREREKERERESCRVCVCV